MVDSGNGAMHGWIRLLIRLLSLCITLVALVLLLVRPEFAVLVYQVVVARA